MKAPNLANSCVAVAVTALIVALLAACGDSTSVASDAGDTTFDGAPDAADDADAGDDADAAGDVIGDQREDPDAEGDSVEADGDDLSGPDGDADSDGGGLDARDDGGEEEPDAPVEVNASNLSYVGNPNNVLSLFVEWETDRAVPGRLRVRCGDGEIDVVLSGDDARTEHEAFVMGLYPGAECTLEVENATGGERSASLIVDDVPSFLPEPTLLATSDAVQPGWTMLNLNNRFDPVPAKAVMVDEQGRYRWYHSVRTTRPGSDTDVTPTSEGVLIGGWGPGTTPRMIDWTGEVIWTADIRNHHDIDYDEETRTFWYLSNWETCAVEGVMPASSFRQWSRDEERDLFTWSICEEWTPPARSDDWAHMNALEVLPGGDHVLFSARNQNALFLVRVEPDVAVEWVLGGAQSTFDMVTRDGIDPVFWHQHSAEWLPDGNVILFDNGLSGTREYSRALELAFDVDEGEAWAVWEYRPDPDIFAPVWSDADRQPNGNTLVLFGLNSSTEETHLIEVDAAGETVWYLRLPERWGAYRAERVIDPPFGYVIEE